MCSLYVIVNQRTNKRTFECGQYFIIYLLGILFGRKRSQLPTTKSIKVIHVNKKYIDNWMNYFRLKLNFYRFSIVTRVIIVSGPEKDSLKLSTVPPSRCKGTQISIKYPKVLPDQNVIEIPKHPICMKSVAHRLHALIEEVI